VVGAVALPSRAGAAQSPAHAGHGILTVTGAIARSNRGPLDPALDQLMVKHGPSSTRHGSSMPRWLARLPVVTIQPTLEYDAKLHKLSARCSAAWSRPPA